MSTWGLKVNKRELSWTGRLGRIWMQTFVSLGLKGEEERTVLDRTISRNMVEEICLLRT
jgi:hypothetical protein